MGFDAKAFLRTLTAEATGVCYPLALTSGRLRWREKSPFASAIASDTTG